MLPKTRPQRLFALVLSTVVVLAAPALDAATKRGAKRAAPAATPALAKCTETTGPWLYRCSDIPPDKEWTFGELPNGVRYAVRRNGVPPDQVSIRIRMDVGSMYELPHEMGFSHLLEHMVFRQSKYLGDGEAIPTWQRMGAAFGSDTNAQTGPLSTTYKLDLPDATTTKVDTSLKLLSGMMIAPTLSPDNVAKDVPIVLAEKREGGGTAERVWEQTQATLFAGQKLGARPVIGTDATLQGATSATVKAFHKRWYRPENAVIIIAGDISPAVMEASIKKWFSDWQGEGPRTPEPPFGDPAAPKGARGIAPVGQTKVIVEPDLPRSVTYAVLRPWRPVRDTQKYNQGNMLDALAAAIINRRLEARARAGGSFLIAQVGREKVLRSADMTVISITPLGADWKAAVADTRAVIADAMAKPPTQAEIDREVKEFGVAYESSVEQRRLQSGASLADDVVAALDIRETVASPEVVQKIFLDAMPTYTPANIQARTKAMFTGTVTRGVYITPAANEATGPALRTALAAPVAGNANARVDTKGIDFASLPPIGAPKEPVATRETGVMDIEQIDYANGVKVLLWPTTNEPGRVTLKVRFGAGYRAFNEQTAPYATLGNLALVSAGVGTLDQEAIDKAMTGRKMGWEFELQDGYFSFNADTRAADLPDQLYLFANKFQNPRWDANPILRAQAASKLSYDNYATSPQGVLERDLSYYARGRDPALRTPSPKDIEGTSVAGFRSVWEPILKQGPIEIQLFGDFKRADALAAITKTFGALPDRGALPTDTAPAVARTLPPSLEPVLLFHRGDKQQAAAILGWPTGGGMAGIRESRQLEILTQIISNRVLDKVRERMGQSYSPQAVNDWPIDLEGGGKIMVLAQMKPEMVPVFFEVADEIAADLIANPVTADELERVTEPLKQQLTRAVTGSNGFIMYLVEGATQDPMRYSTVRSLLPDYTVTTPERMQALAAKYLLRDKSWRLAVIPQGMALAPRPSSAAGR